MCPVCHTKRTTTLTISGLRHSPQFPSHCGRNCDNNSHFKVKENSLIIISENIVQNLLIVMGGLYEFFFNEF